MFTQQQTAILLEALDLWVKQNGVRVAGAAHEIVLKMQQMQQMQQPAPPQVPARNGPFNGPFPPQPPAPAS